MAKRFSASRLFSKRKYPVVISGAYAVGADGSITSATAVPGVTIVRTSEGLHTFTFTDAAMSLVEASASIWSTALVNSRCQFGEEDVDGAKTASLYFYTVDRSPNVVLDPDSSTVRVRFVLELGS